MSISYELIKLLLRAIATTGLLLLLLELEHVEQCCCLTIADTSQLSVQCHHS